MSNGIVIKIGGGGGAGVDDTARAAITALQNQKGAANGIATLNEDRKLSSDQVPDNVVTTGQDGKIPLEKLPEGLGGDGGVDIEARQAISDLQNLIGEPEGIATLDSSGKVPLEQLPEGMGSGGVDTEARASIAQLESQVNDIASQLEGVIIAVDEIETGEIGIALGYDIVSPVGNTYTIDLQNKPIKKAKIVVDDVANKTIDVSNVPSGNCDLTIELIYASASVITWFEDISWLGGTAPTFTTGNIYRISLYYNGELWYGNYEGGWPTDVPDVPDAVYLRCSAGLFDFSVINLTNKLWTFGDGSTSSDAHPAVTLPDEQTVVLTGNFSASPNWALLANNTGDRFIGSLADLHGKPTHTLSLADCTNVTGSLADLQGNVTHTLDLSNCPNITGSLADLEGKIDDTLNLSNCTNVTGDLADLDGKIRNKLVLINCTNITGSLADLGGNITSVLALNYCNKITGSLADLEGNITVQLALEGCTSITGSLTDLGGKISSLLNLAGCTNITGVYTPTDGVVPTTTILSNTGLSAADIDQTLINYATLSSKTNGTFTASNMTRTAASDEAIATLTGRGWTINGLTKVE